jgi:hypothetical protein
VEKGTHELFHNVQREPLTEKYKLTVKKEEDICFTTSMI